MEGDEDEDEDEDDEELFFVAEEVPTPKALKTSDWLSRYCSRFWACTRGFVPKGVVRVET